MTLDRPSIVLSCVLFALSSGACSAVVSPDTTLLGDGGASTGDGAVHDAGGLACTASCDDGIACTTDGCSASTGTCQHVPTDSLCGMGMRCAATGCVPSACTSDASCNDGDPCNGAETCSGGGACISGTAPDCNDHADCTADSCVTGTGCVHTPDDTACDDHVGCTTDSCSSTGCAHAPDSTTCNGGCRSGATCGATGCTGGVTTLCVADGNPCTADPTICDPSTGSCLHPLHDNDMDGYPNASAVGTTGMTVDCTSLGGTDCNDADPSIHPGATEICNGRDDNCNGMIDEGCIAMPGHDTCATESAIALTGGFPPGVGASMGSVSASNPGLTDDYTESGSACMSRSGGTIGGGTGDGVYYIDVFGAADISINSHGSSYDTVVAAAVGATCGTWNTHCNDDTSGSDHTSTVPTFCAGSPGVTTRIHILIDGFDSASMGNYTINVTVTPRLAGCF